MGLQQAREKMKITEVRIFPTKSKDGRLKAYAAITFDDWFVVRNIKVIQGNGGLFVAMPSRKAMVACPRCKFKNVRGSKYCNDCGASLGRTSEPELTTENEKQSDHMDIAHPIKQECRVYIQDKILGAFDSEMERKAAEGEDYQPLRPAAEAVPDTVAEKLPEAEEDKPSDVDRGSILSVDGQDIEL